MGMYVLIEFLLGLRFLDDLNRSHVRQTALTSRSTEVESVQEIRDGLVSLLVDLDEIKLSEYLLGRLEFL